mgnify:CR=1 FL=1
MSGADIEAVLVRAKMQAAMEKRVIVTQEDLKQTIKDFIQVDIAKSEAFWAAINLADKKAMKKITKFLKKV